MTTPASGTPERRFRPTRWSLVARAGSSNGEARRQALAELCQAYWYPLYAFVRRRAHDESSAADLTQEFFARLLEGDRLADADPARGRFRSFLLVSLRSFLANQSERQGAKKRGGDRTTFSMDFDQAATRFAQEPRDDETPDRALNRQWALELVDRSVARLRGEYAGRGRLATFQRLEGFLSGDGSDRYRRAATDLGSSESAVKVTVHRMRVRLQEILREEVLQTVEHPSSIEEEMRDLFAALVPPHRKKL